MVGLRRTLLCALCLSVSLAVASCAQEAPQVAEAPQAIEAPQVVEAPQSAAELSPAATLGLTLETLPDVDSSTSAQPLAMTIICEAVGVDVEWKRWGRLEQRLVPTSSEGIVAQGHIVKVRDSGTLEVRHYPGKVRTSGTHGAWERLIKSEADIIFVARKPSPDELALASELSIDLDYRPVALDAFVFIVNELNPIDGLTLDQIQDIYTGRFTLWTELGIKPARDIPQIVEFMKTMIRAYKEERWKLYFGEGGEGGEADKIIAYQRNKNSGSQQLMLSLVMKDKEMSTPIHNLIGMTMISVYDNLAREHRGIAYTVYFYEKNMATPRSTASMMTSYRANSRRRPDPQLRDHKVIGVDGVAPNAKTIRSREYPFTTEVYMAIRADTPEDHTARRLRDFLLTPDGQKLVAKSGYVPYTPLGD